MKSFAYRKGNAQNGIQQTISDRIHLHFIINIFVKCIWLCVCVYVSLFWYAFVVTIFFWFFFPLCCFFSSFFFHWNINSIPPAMYPLWYGPSYLKENKSICIMNAIYSLGWYAYDRRVDRRRQLCECVFGIFFRVIILSIYLLVF